MREQDLEKLDKVFSIIQKLVTIFAIIIGGLWTYNMFILHREAYAKADISFVIEEIKLSDEYILIQVFIEVENTGNTVLKLLKGDVILYDVSLPNPYIQNKLEGFGKPACRKKPKFLWDTIQFVNKEWKEGEISIEPSCKDQLDFEFIIKSKYEVIKVYAWFTDLNEDKKVGDDFIGWTASKIYNVKS